MEEIEQTHFIEVPTEKIYTEKAIWLGAFLGGPLVAGYFIAENFKVFNDDEKAKKTWMITIAATVVIFSILFLIPEDTKIPTQLFPLVYIVIASYLTKYFQEQKMNEHIKNGGKKFNWWRTIAVGLIGSAVTIGVLIGFAFLFPQ